MTQSVNRVERLENPTFMFICIDGPDTPPLRKQHLIGHLKHIEHHNEKYRVAGPMKGDDGEIIGSFFLVEAATKDAATEIMMGDPYMESEMYAYVTVNEFVPACGSWMNGVIWSEQDVSANMDKYTK